MAILSVAIEDAGYEVNQPVIQHIQFTLDKGELIGIIGPNGADV